MQLIQFISMPIHTYIIILILIVISFRHFDNLSKNDEIFFLILQQAQVPLVSRDTCQRSYSDIQDKITERMRCVGYFEGGVDGCQGDSGGPLVCPSNNKWYLMGIVS